MCRKNRIKPWIILRISLGKPTNLTVSGQLNGETYAMAFKNIYTFGPTFRAEKFKHNQTCG